MPARFVAGAIAGAILQGKVFRLARFARSACARVQKVAQYGPILTNTAQYSLKEGERLLNYVRRRRYGAGMPLTSPLPSIFLLSSELCPLFILARANFV